MYTYCLAEAAQRYQIELLVSQMMSNHHHTPLFDRFGRVVEFMEHFHKMLAKGVNALRGRWENMFSSEPPCLIRLENPADVIAKIVYTAANPVLDDLVEHVDHWPGPKMVRAFLRQEPIEVDRPSVFFQEDGLMPKHVSLRFVIPPELGEADEVVNEVRTQIALIETRESERRLAKGKRVVGRRGVLRQSWRDSPISREPRRNLRPRVAARSWWTRVAAVQRDREFEAEYKLSRIAFLAKQPVVFPAGTYWLARFAGVAVAPFTSARRTIASTSIVSFQN